MLLNCGSKRFLNHGFKRFFNYDSIRFRNHGFKKFLNHGPKKLSHHGSKSTKSYLIKKPLHTYKPFLFNVTKKINFKIRMLKKIKCKFAAGQLSAKSPLQLSTQSLIFVDPIMNNGEICF